MYLVSLHGHATSVSPGSRGAPTEWRHLTKSASRPIAWSTLVPMRVMMCIETAT